METDLKVNIDSYFPKVLQTKVKTVLPIFNCLITNLGTVLKAEGYKNHLELMLCRNMNVYWGFANNKIVFNSNLYPTFEDLETIDGIKFEYKFYDKAEDLLFQIEKKLSAGLPQIIDVDQYYISGFIYYKREHKLHTTLVVGMSNTSVYIKDLETVREIFIDDFISSLELGNFSILQYSLSLHTIEYDETLVKSFITRNNHLGINKNKLMREEFPHAFSSLDDEMEVYCGVHAIKKFALDILEIIPNLDNDRGNELLSKLGSRTYDLVVQRYWHIAFWDSVNRLLHQEAIISELIEKLNQLVHDWKVIQNMFHKASGKLKDPMINRISDRLKRIADCEEKYFLKACELS